MADGIHVSGKKLTVILTLFTLLSIAGNWVIPVFQERNSLDKRITTVEVQIKSLESGSGAVVSSIEQLKTENANDHKEITRDLTTINRQLGEISGRLGIATPKTSLVITDKKMEF